jgi:uncharacterized membrane protein
MAIRLKYRSPTGETRSWTLKEWVQGRPLGHPSHPLFVHFPVAFYLAVVVFDVMTRISPNAGLVQAATYLQAGAFLATVGAALTGLIDWAGMIRGSSKRKLGNRHLTAQVIGAVIFTVVLVMRWPNRTQEQAEIMWIVLGVIGYLVVVVGQYLGGVLVYEKAMRVSTGGATE